MKLGTALFQGEQYIFIDQGDYVLIPGISGEFFNPIFRDMQLLIEQFDTVKSTLEKIITNPTPEIRLSKALIQPLAPIPQPKQNIMCLGLNYQEHINEAAEFAGKQWQAPKHPIVFTKSTYAVAAHNDRLPYNPETCSQLDWESELGIIIGKPAHNISRDDALDYIFGYTVINDISARDIQRNHKQFFLGKSLAGSCPVGPHIVTRDDIADPASLRIMCRVNGVTKQDSNTKHMIFDIPEIISTLSHNIGLHAGDIIATGTPDGVGFAREPAEFLQSGDVVECEVENVGILRTYIS